MPKTPLLKPGAEPSLLSAAFANEHVMIPLGALRNLTVSPMGAGKLVINGEKAVLVLDPVAIAAAAVLPPLAPFKSGALAVSFKYGTIGGLPLDTFGPIATAATRYFFARTTCSSGGLLTAVELYYQTTGTAPASSDTVAYLPLGRAVVTGGALTTEYTLAGSKSYQRCGYAGNYTHHFDPL